MKDVLIVIPARMGSTRFPGKVLARLGSRSIVEWCWRAARASGLGPVIVATDAKIVADEVRRFGGDVALTPSSCPSGSDRVWLVARNRRESVILNYQGDMPLIHPRTLAATVAALDRSTDVSTAVIPLQNGRRLRDPNVVKAVLGLGGRCLYFSRLPVPYSREHSLSTPHWEHLGLYAYGRAALKRFISLSPSPLEKIERLEQLRALEGGMSLRAAIVRENPVSVDVPADLKLAASILRRGNHD